VDRRSIDATEALRFLGWLAAAHPEVDVAAVGAKAGLAPSVTIADRISIKVVFDLWAEAVRATDDPGLPIAFGAASRLEDMGLFGLSLLNCGRVDQALERAVRFQSLMSDSGSWTIALDGDRVECTWHRAGARDLGHRAANETVLAEHVAFSRQLVTDTYQPLRVCFSHSAPKDTRAHRAFFRCPIEWDAESDGLWLTIDDYRRELPGANPGLDAHFRSLLETTAIPAPTSMGDRVRALIAPELGDGEPSITVLSKRLGTSERTLRRRLAEEGASFRGLVDQVRRERAEALLGAERLSLTEIAFALGFSEGSAFTRAFNRWFGVPPRAYRRAR
jgi:AraC-like DNA-binding protein